MSTLSGEVLRLHAEVRRRPLQQVTELIFRESRVADDTSHRKGVHRVVSGDGKDPHAIAHHDMLALADNSKADLLQGANGILVVDAGELRNA